MRRTIFRGKRCDNKEWVEGNYCYDVNNNEIEIPCIQIKPGCEYEVDFETVGQFTGVCDKNGNKIFEGDIIKSGKFVSVIKWNESYCGFLAYCEKYNENDKLFFLNHNTNLYYYSRQNKLEVIGNIHDNPELLEGK